MTDPFSLHVHRARLRKADRLVVVAAELAIPAATLQTYADRQWAWLAQLADVHMPSDTTRRLVVEWTAAAEHHSPPADEPETP